MATTNPGFISFVNQINQSVTAFNKQAKLMNLARVIHVVYGPTIPGTNIPDQYYTNPNSLGTIAYQLFGEAQDRTSQSAGNPTAKPLNGGLKRIPVVGEIVQIIVGTSIMEQDKEEPQYYYTYPLNLWNHPHHNASPDRGDYGDYVNQQVQTYQQSQFSQTPDNPDPKAPVNMPLGPGFIEKGNIKALREFPGDVIIEGRWGNSIRFGSTSTEAFRDQNNWSVASAPGNPITIIRNGQGRTIDQEGFIPTVENINRDPSSIYLTQGQKVIIDDIQNNFNLNSLGIVLQNNITLSIPIQQNLTSYESISAAEQDRIVAETTNPEQSQEQTNDLGQPN